MNFKKINNPNNIFSTTRSMLVDGKERRVTVVGVRNEVVKHDMKPKVIDRGNVVEMTNIMTRKKVRTFDVVYAICNPDDTFDEITLTRIINRRLKKKDFHLHLETPQYFGSELCNMIVDNEASYIIRHIEDFIPKK